MKKYEDEDTLAMSILDGKNANAKGRPFALLPQLLNSSIFAFRKLFC
jgi:hypothetical protein